MQQHYKAPDNSIHIVAPEYAHLLPAGSVQVTEDEANALIPPPAPPDPRLVLDEQERQSARQDSAIQTLVDATPAGLQTWAGNNFPTLTAPERNKMGMLLQILSVAVRDKVRA